MNGLFRLLDALAVVARQMDPRRLPDLVRLLDGLDIPPENGAARLAMRAVLDLRGSISSENPTLEAFKALRWINRAIEALSSTDDEAVRRYLLAPACRDDRVVLARLGGRFGTLLHEANERSQRGGFSVFVPPGLEHPAPLLMALHGGSGHGRLFLWNWIPEARARGFIVVAPTSQGGTWSLQEPEVDAERLVALLPWVSARWPVDAGRTLLMGMSDGGTFTLLHGLTADCPCTHLAPVAASFHPLLLAFSDPERIVGLPVHLTHGMLDWMFPVDGARVAAQMLGAAGAKVEYREIADLSHAYPRDGQEDVLDWWLGNRHAAAPAG